MAASIRPWYGRSALGRQGQRHHLAQGLGGKGLVTINRMPGGRAEAVDLTAEGRNRVAARTASCE